MRAFEGKWVFVSGASRGVGRQLALGFASEGARLVLHARTLAALAPVAEALAGKAEVHCVEAELKHAPEVQRLISEIRVLCGCPDVIYNNAAIMTPWTEPHATSAADYGLSFDVNVIAPALICDAFIDAMKARGSGHIVNVTSGIENIRELLPYSVSKAALDRYVRDVSPSLEGSGVVMSLLDPGWLRTDLGGEQAPNAVESVLPRALLPAKLPKATKSGALYQAQPPASD